MKVAVIFNKDEIRDSDVIYRFGMPTKERYKHRTIEMVASALESGGHNVRIIEGNKFVIDDLQNFMPRVVSGERLGMIFNMAYGIQGQSRYTHIPAMLEMLGLPYVGSGPAAHAIALDKVLSKIVFLKYNLPTPPFWVYSNCDGNFAPVRYPAIVKPKMEAISFGLRVVNNEEELREAVNFITSEFQQQALIEEFIPGREFAVGLLGNSSTLETLPIVEIDLEGNPNAVQTLDEKMNNPRKKICPADVSHDVAEQLRTFARDAFNVLGLNDFARVDFRMDEKNNLQILEINSMASLNPTGSFVYAGNVAGMDFNSLVNRMLETAALRYFGKTFLETEEKQKEEIKSGEHLSVRIRSYLRGHLSTIVDYTDKMVSLNSYVYNIEGVNTLGNWISNRFQQLGFTRHLYPQTEIGNSLYFTNHVKNENDVLLLGHLDTPYDYRSFAPFKEDRGKLYGSGIASCKGGIAVILAALQALRFARVLRRLRCGVLLTSDDTLHNRFTKNIISELTTKSKRIIGTNHGGINGGLAISCTGILQLYIEFSNNKVTKNKKKPDLATLLAKKVIALQKFTSKTKGIYVQVKALNLDSFPGQKAEFASATINVFYKQKHLGEKIIDKIKEIIESGSDGRVQVRFRMTGSRQPVESSAVNRKYFADIKKMAVNIEVMVKPIHQDYPSDISHTPINIPMIEGFGPIGGEINSPLEFIIRDSLIDRSALLALVLNFYVMKIND